VVSSIFIGKTNRSFPQLHSHQLKETVCSSPR